METDKVPLIAFSIIIFGIIIGIGISLLVKVEEAGSSIVSNSDTLLVKSGGSASLTAMPYQNFQALTYNQTWLNFDGKDDFVEIPDKDFYSPNTTGMLTVSYWFNMQSHKFKGISEGYVNPINKNRFAPSPTAAEWTFRMYNDSSTDNRPCRKSFYIFNESGGFGIGSYFEDNQSANNCSNMDNVWVNVVGMINGTNTFIFKDGLLRATDVYAGQIYPNNTNATLKFGYDTQSGGNFYNGSLDSIRVYNRSLTYDEISNIYLAGVNERITEKPIYNLSFLNFTGDSAGAGSGDVAYVDSPFQFASLGNETSYEGWIYRNPNNLNNVVFGSSVSSSPLFRISSANALVFFPNSAGAGTTFSNVVPDSTWVHYVLVYNNTNGNVTFYRNGVINSSQTTANRYNLVGNLWLGKRSANSDIMQGYMKGFSIYNKSLNATEVSQIYSQGMTKNNYSVGRILHYPMNESFGVTLKDSASGLDGLIRGGLRSRNSIQWANDGIISSISSLNSPSTTGLVGHWSFNENQGIITYDKSLFAINGTIYNSTTYQNDGINIILDSSDYSLSDSTFTLTNSIYSWSQLIVTYTSRARTTLLPSDYLADLSSWLPLFILVLVVGIIFAILGNKRVY